MSILTTPWVLSGEASRIFDSTNGKGLAATVLHLWFVVDHRRRPLFDGGNSPRTGTPTPRLYELFF